MKFSINSLLGLTTISAIVVGLFAIAVRVAIESDRGVPELIGGSVAMGVFCGLLGVCLGGLCFSRQPLSLLAAGCSAAITGGVFAMGSGAGPSFATSVLGYCVMSATVLLVVSTVFRWSSKGTTDPFDDLLSKRLGVKDDVKVEVVEKDGLPPRR